MSILPPNHYVVAFGVEPATTKDTNCPFLLHSFACASLCLDIEKQCRKDRERHRDIRNKRKRAYLQIPSGVSGSVMPCTSPPDLQGLFGFLRLNRHGPAITQMRCLQGFFRLLRLAQHEPLSYDVSPTFKASCAFFTFDVSRL